MKEKNLHIICLDIPWPVDYGGVFDLFFKIKSLFEEGVKIHLHCFEYGRSQQKELNKYCVDVKYYPRTTGHHAFCFSIPYIVCSRNNPLLLQNLLKDDYPILMEGVHCTYFLQSGDLKDRKVFVRLHNVEYLYYDHLAKTTNSFLKKLYYQRESKLLKIYEASLKNKATFWTVNNADKVVFENELGFSPIDNLPPFLPAYQPQWSAQKGCYCLYHGNLSVDENEKAVIWLLENVFSTIDIPMVIAGKKPSDQLRKLIHERQSTCLIENPGEKEMQELIQKAQVNILPSFNSTGIKLKLINALFNGRHCLVNSAAVDGTGLADCCTIANTQQCMQEELQKLYHQPYTYYQFNYRSELLKQMFNNKENAIKMIGWIFS